MDFLDFHHHKPGATGVYNLDLQEEVPNFAFSAGLHPKDISAHWKSDFEHIKTRSLSDNCVSVGECGLDSLIHVDDALQSEVFLAHLMWAQEIRKPVTIHCVRRFSQLLQFKTIKIPMVIHGFNKKEQIGRELLDAGFLLSFGRAALENLSLQNLIREIPLQKIFLETDNADFDIALLYEKISVIKNVSVEELNQQMWENLKNVTNYG